MSDAIRARYHASAKWSPTRDDALALFRAIDEAKRAHAATTIRLLAMTADLARAAERIAELEAACEVALAWYGPDGDHISEPARGLLRLALGLLEEMENGYQ